MSADQAKEIAREGINKLPEGDEIYIIDDN
jgi:hypothetical protein